MVNPSFSFSVLFLHSPLPSTVASAVLPQVSSKRRCMRIMMLGFYVRHTAPSSPCRTLFISLYPPPFAKDTARCLARLL